MLARMSSKDMPRAFVELEIVKAERPERVLTTSWCWRIGAEFAGDVEGTGNV
jgi:hypothetical protein